MKPRNLGPLDRPAQVLAGGFGLIFAGIGVTLLVFLWSASLHDFGSPPLFFRITGSFIASAFVLFGGAMIYAAATAQVRTGSRSSQDYVATKRSSSGSQLQSGYSCPRCAAPLADGADVSPSGDVKCNYCKSWFNIHAK